MKIEYSVHYCNPDKVMKQTQGSAEKKNMLLANQTEGGR
jgi:hypothetical protein